MRFLNTYQPKLKERFRYDWGKGKWIKMKGFQWCGTREEFLQYQRNR